MGTPAPNLSQLGISGLPDFGERFENFDGFSQARELFNRCIANSPHGKMIVHATQNNRLSYDSPYGGYFTQALVNIATKLKAGQNYSPVSISDILKHIPTYLQKRGNFQIPAITYNTGNLQVPFAFGFTKPGQQKQTVSTQSQSAVTGGMSLGQGLLLFGLTALVLIAANSK